MTRSIPSWALGEPRAAAPSPPVAAPQGCRPAVEAGETAGAVLGAGRPPLAFFVPGAPRGKGSVRVFNGRAVKDDKTASYMATVTLFARNAAAMAGWPTWDGLASVAVRVVVERPAKLVPNPRGRKAQPSALAFPAGCKPDLDNCAKALLDSLVQAGVLVDDCRVAALSMVKEYAAIGEPPGVHIVVGVLA